MADHYLTGDNAPDYEAPNIVEAKVWAATLATTAASVAVAVLNAVQDNPALLGVFPVWAQSLILVIVPPLLTFLAGYAKRSNRV